MRRENRHRRDAADWAVALALVAAVVVTFWPVLANDFVDWDDDLNLTDNAAYRGLTAAHLRWMFTTVLGGHYQPLSWMTLAVDHALWGMNPTGYHLTNLVLHAANTIVVYLLCRALLPLVVPAPRSLVRAAAAAGALAFGVHPLRVESVAWASERRDVLSGLFYLLALTSYVRAHTGAPERRRRRLVTSLGCLVTSLLAKAWGITFPVVLLLLDAYPLRRCARERARDVLIEKVPFAIAAGVGAVVAFAAQRSVEEMRTLSEHPLGARVAQAAYGLCFYVGKTLLPVRLSPAYLLDHVDPMDPRYLASAVVVVAVSLACIAAWRRHPWAAAAWASYAVIVAPVLGLAQVGPQLVADRYSYLSCVPWALVAAGGLLRQLRSTAARARGATVAAAVVLALLAVLTQRQARVWRSSITLWDHVLALDPRNYVAYTARGWARGDVDAAIADYSEALRINPHYYLAYFDRGNARQERGDLDGAVADFTAAIAVLPADPKAYNNRGWAREAAGDLVGAAADYARALELAAPEWRHRELATGNLRRVRARIAADAD